MTTPPHAHPWRHSDLGLSALLAVQSLTLFVAIPLGPVDPLARMLLDACHIAFAAICIAVLTRHRLLQATLFASVALLSIGPIAGDRLMGKLGFGTEAGHEIVSLTAFVFNGAVTALVARHVFAEGRVTARRVQGAILLYLNIAALFAIAFNQIASLLPGAITLADGTALPTGPGMRTADLAYFSITIITTTGFGDIVPIHPLARSLANLEAVFGQLFPATLLARLVALQLAHDDRLQPPPATDEPPGG